MKIKLRILIFTFIFLALQEKYTITFARQVKKVSDVVTAKKEIGESGYFSSQKEIVPIERITRISGRKMRKKAIKGKSKKHSKGDRDDDFMAFASDYHPPKPHPPKNN